MSDSHRSATPNRSRFRHAFVGKAARFGEGRWVGICLLLLAIVTTTITIVQQHQQSRLSDRQDAVVACLAGYTNGFADALDARTAATTKSQLALDRIINSISSEPGASKKFEEALANYKKVRADQTRTALSNPYPPAPREACEIP